MCEWVGLAKWLGKENVSGDGMLWEDTTYNMVKKASQFVFQDSENLASENMCSVERHTLILNQSTSLICKRFCETKATPYQKGEYSSDKDIVWYN